MGCYAPSWNRVKPAVGKMARRVTAEATDGQPAPSEAGRVRDRKALGLPRGFPVFEAPTATRSRNMAAMRAHNTKPELAVRRALHAAGFRFRVQTRHLPGRPDVVLPRWRRAV